MFTSTKKHIHLVGKIEKNKLKKKAQKIEVSLSIICLQMLLGISNIFGNNAPYGCIIYGFTLFSNNSRAHRQLFLTYAHYHVS